MTVTAGAAGLASPAALAFLPGVLPEPDPAS